jgi:hypothetical protein
MQMTTESPPRDDYVPDDVSDLSLSEDDARPVAGIINGVAFGAAFLIALFAIVMILVD